MPPSGVQSSAPLTIGIADDLFGTYDAARYTADHITGARFVGYPSGGHFDQVDAGQRFAASVIQFFQSRKGQCSAVCQKSLSVVSSVKP